MKSIIAQETFVPVGIAQLAKLHNFNDACLFHYWIYPDGNIEILENGGYNCQNINFELNDKQIAMPSHEQLIEWFIREHNLYGTAIPYMRDAWVYDVSLLDVYNDSASVSLVNEMMEQGKYDIVLESVVTQSENKWTYQQAKYQVYIKLFEILDKKEQHEKG